MTKPRDTTDGEPPHPDHWEDSAPKPINPKTGQHESYWVLPEEERAKGFIRPVRKSYKHLKCGTTTTMGRSLAETFARDFTYYSATFCCDCKAHFSVGEVGEFVWLDGSKVGT